MTENAAVAARRELTTAVTRLRDDHNCDNQRVDSTSRELLGMISALLRAREPLAAWLEGELHRWDPEADIQSWDHSHERALAVARAINAPARPGTLQGGPIVDKLAALLGDIAERP